MWNDLDAEINTESTVHTVPPFCLAIFGWSDPRKVIQSLGVSGADLAYYPGSKQSSLLCTYGEDTFIMT